jgi:ferredoxin-NADP reductase
VTARVVGDGTERIAALRPGTPVLVEGPYGVLTGEQRTARTLLLIGAGAGVAPLVALAESETYPSGGAVLITRDHDEAEAIRAKRINELTRTRGLHHVRLDGARARIGSTWMPAAYSAWAGPDLLRYACADLTNADVYVCGPPPWMAAVIADLRRAGAPRSAIHTEAVTI